MGRIKDKFKTVSLLRKEFICDRPKSHNVVTGRVKKANFLPVLKPICKVETGMVVLLLSLLRFGEERCFSSPLPVPPTGALDDHCCIGHGLGCDL